MTQEHKDLLLKDLCSRLPYGVKIEVIDTMIVGKTYKCVDVLDCYNLNRVKNKHYSIKPYLFPPQSLQQAQKDEICKAVDGMEKGSAEERWDAMIKFVDLMLKYHVDYRGLISKGLAIDASNLNIY